jgi:uncharacterized protein YhdP
MRALVHKVRRWPRRLVITLAVVAAMLLAARIALPHVVKRHLNQRLEEIPGYTGHVSDVNIALIRGGYQIHGISIFREPSQVQQPFFSARLIDFTVAWRELLRGKLVSDMQIDRGQLNIVRDEIETETQADLDRRWQEVIKDIFPIHITHLELSEGAIRYRDNTQDPEVDVFIRNLHAVATGLRNRVAENGDEFPARIVAHGESLGGGRVELQIRAEPLAPQPHFHLAARIDDVNLPDLNEELEAYANVNVSQGTFRMAAEMAGKDGGFQGYVKPFFEDLDFENIEDEDRGLLERLWEKVVAGLAWLVKNKSRDQVGTRIPFEGMFGDPEVGLWTTITNLFRHGFIRAFNPTIEGSVTPENVLPDGSSADGRDVADVKDETPAGAPTGRDSGGSGDKASRSR